MAATITNVRNMTANLARFSGLTLALDANSPGDRHGTRYQIHVVRPDGRYERTLIRATGSKDALAQLAACFTMVDALNAQKGR